MANIIKIDNAELKRRKQNKNKKQKTIACRILIVCEGEKTEPNYFKAFSSISNSGFVIELDVEGGKMNTKGVVQKAIELRKNALVPYDRVWAVFDKDDFPANNFNEAIRMAEEHGINVAWSNEAFELWYLYHFHNRITGMKRTEYQKAISEAINEKQPKSKKGNYVYLKNDENTCEILTLHGNQAQAIRWAEDQHKQWEDQQFAKHNPCTTVYQLVRQLINEDNELIAEVMAKINSK